MKGGRDDILYSLAYSIPMLSILDSREQAEVKKIIRRLNSYKKIYTYLGAGDVFEKISGNLYAELRAGRRPRDLPVEKVERRLRDTLQDIFMNVINELREEGYGRDSDKIEDFVLKGEFKNAYLTLKEIREIETHNEIVEKILEKIDSSMKKINLMKKAGVDVDEITWKMAELLGVNRIKLSDKKMIMINDETGNSACLVSTHLRRMGIEHLFISTKGSGDYWLTHQNVENAISPALQKSTLPEIVVKEKKIVILEDLNYLILSNSFGAVYKFLQYLKSKAKGKIIVTGNFKMMNEREIARLRGLFDSTVTLHTLFGLCTWGLVGIRERKNKGALLLAKELVEDFEGDVVMIADFGGDKYLHPQRLNFEISDKINTYLEKGDVIIDSIDLMIDENGLDKIYLWLKGIRDSAIMTGNSVYVTLNNIITKERDYLRPVMDIDVFYLAKLDTKILDAIYKKMEIIENAVNKNIEKECAYNMETIRQKYERYSKYLAPLKDEIESVLKSQSTYNLDFLLKTTPLRVKIESQVEFIEKKVEEYKNLKEELERDIQVAKEYAEVDDASYFMKMAVEMYESGDIERALEKIKIAKSKMDKINRNAISKAENIRKEFECVDYLLPVYFQSKLKNFKNGINDLQAFTSLYKEIKRVITEKVESEYERLKKYSAISGIPLPNLESSIKRMKFCDYRKERDQFMEQFEGNKEQMVESMQRNAVKVIEFLEENGYSIPVSRTEINLATNFDTIFRMVDRLYNHLSMVISKSIENMKKRYPDYMKRYEMEAERIIVDASINPVDAISRYKLFMSRFKREIGEQKAKLLEIRKRLEEYYSLFRSYNMSFEEWYPKKLEEGEVIISFLEHLFGGLNPDIEVDIGEIDINDDLTANIKVIIQNTGNYPAKNVSIEMYGAVEYKEKMDSVGKGEVREVNVKAKIVNPKENIKVDVFFENFNGDISSKSFLFEANIKGYTITYATGEERCALCRGKIFKGTEMLVCSECGATYHPKCAQRLQKCKMCGNIFLF